MIVFKLVSELYFLNAIYVFVHQFAQLAFLRIGKGVVHLVLLRVDDITVRIQTLWNFVFYDSSMHLYNFTHRKIISVRICPYLLRYQLWH